MIRKIQGGVNTAEIEGEILLQKGRKAQWSGLEARGLPARILRENCAGRVSKTGGQIRFSVC